MNNSKSQRLINQIASAVIIAGALVLTPVIFGGTGAGAYSGAPINLDLVDADLKAVLSVFSDATEMIFAMDAQTAANGGLDHLVSATYESVPWDRALEEILSEAGLEWTLEGKVLWIHLPAYTPTGDRNFTGDAINLRLADAKLVDVLGTMSKVSGLNMDFDPNLETTVSVKLRSVPWDQALDLILRISGCEFALEGDVLKVEKRNDSEGMQLMTSSVS